MFGKIGFKVLSRPVISYGNRIQTFLEIELRAYKSIVPNLPGLQITNLIFF
jgi:hypothetical protein